MIHCIALERNIYRKKNLEREWFNSGTKTLITHDIDKIMKDLPKIDSDIKGLYDSVKRQDNALANIKENLKKVSKELNSKIDISYKAEVSEKVSKFCSYQHIKDVKIDVKNSLDKFKEKLLKFHNHIVKFAKDVKNSKVIIQRFDELICEKASKFEVTNSASFLERLSKEVDKIKAILAQDSTPEELRSIHNQIDTLRDETAEYKSTIIAKLDSTIEGFTLQLEDNMIKFIDKN